MNNPKYNYAVVRTYTRTRLIHAEDKNDLLRIHIQKVLLMRTIIFWQRV
jgi:hypothetical protein